MRIEMKLHTKESGFSLIELMVAMLIGVIILLGLLSLFTSSSALNRSQSGLSILQENGRYAITRIKTDIELAGRKHCATLALPNEFVVDWNQGYLMNSWTVDRNVAFNNGWPLASQVRLDTVTALERNQLSDTAFTATTLTAFPLDPAFFMKGHDCVAGTCTPATNVLGADSSAAVPGGGSTNGSRALNTDVLTVRYLSGGTQVNAITEPAGPGLPAIITLDEDPGVSTNNSPAIIGDCDTTFVSNAVWAGTSVSMNSLAFPSVSVASDTKLFSYTDDLRTVTYHLELATDPNDANRLISSLMRTQNGTTQLIVEGVERFDLFYLAQLQTGEVARLTAGQVEAVTGGGDINSDGAVDVRQGCIQPPRVSPATKALGLGIANDAGCLWRSIYAVEINLLLNTVNNSSQLDTDSFIYTPDGNAAQKPTTLLPSGLPRERMYRRQFSAVVPIRSYTL